MIMTRTDAPSLVIVDLISDNDSLKFEVAGRIAAAMLALKEENGACMPQDLNEKGFKPAEVANNWNAAHFLIAIKDLTTWGEGNGKNKK